MDDRFVNLGEEVILTLLWQSGTSESATVCMLYLLLTVQMRSFACVCERDKGPSGVGCLNCGLCVWEIRNHLNRGLFANTYKHHHCVCHVTLFPSRLELMLKLRILLTVFTFILKAKAHDYGKGRYISDKCLRCSANHNALCQLANQSRLCLSEGTL